MISITGLPENKGKAVIIYIRKYLSFITSHRERCVLWD